MPGLTQLMNYGTVPLDELFSVSSWLMVAVLVVMFAMVLYIVERTHAARKDRVLDQSKQSTD